MTFRIYMMMPHQLTKYFIAPYFLTVNVYTNTNFWDFLFLKSTDFGVLSRKIFNKA
jgi:hypothetical protein